MQYVELRPALEGDGATGYRPAVIEDPGCWYDGGECACCEAEVVRHGPYLGDALLPADVRAAKWAKEQGLPYR